ncbi:MAG: hypothetical protein COA78_20385 [Blastopirellula sp.]|nr:MAG: hypothetical protein COA78_20385 [Blastopirellula sp.]
MDETVDRYLSNIVTPHLDPDTVMELREAILALEITPSMRALMTAGPAAKRDNTCMYNCAYLPVDDPKSFDEALFILMCGTGVGFSVERQYINKLPEVPELFFDTTMTIPIMDSKEGWAKGYRLLLSSLWAGEVPKWDTSRLRGAGERLKTFGGRSSGPAPLTDLFNFTVHTFKEAAGRRLTSIECHDLMCKVGEIVVSGGVRRSALLSLSNLSDDRMRHAKTGQFGDHRYLANNSVCYTEKPDMESFIREWTALIESKSGERGIFNREAAQKQTARNGRRDANKDWGTNPCCFTGDMKLRTTSGNVRFDELVGKESVEIVNNLGEVSVGSVWGSGVKSTVYVGYEGLLKRKPIQVTPDHVFMLTDGSECIAEELVGKQPMPYILQAPNRRGTDTFLAGFMVGDGALNRLNSDKHKGLEVYFSKKDKDIAKSYGQGVGRWYSRKARGIAVSYSLPATVIGSRGLPTSIVSQEGLQGLYSANGGVIRNGRVSLKTIDKGQADRLVEVLGKYGVTAYITTNKTTKVKFYNGEYTCKVSYDVNIGRYDSLLAFCRFINFGQDYKRQQLQEMLLRRAPKIKSVKKGPDQEVFDFSEPKNHWGVVEGVVVHNSEIILRPYQFCNLTECVIRASDDFDTLARKVRLATILGTVQSTYTDFKYLRRVWHNNTKEEGLLGVSLTGIMDNPLMTTKNRKLEDTLTALRGVAIETNKEWADKLGIPVSAAITTVKPSGTVSQLVDSSSGIHARHSKYYIRTVRGNNTDPVTQFMKDMGVVHSPDVTKPETVTVFSFPVKAPPKAVTRGDLTALDQLNMWLMYQRHWCEHKPSVTISVKSNEWLEVGDFVYKNFDEVSGISFLPYDDHVYQQAPYQEASKREYQTLLKLTPESFDWTKLSEYELQDSTVGMSTMACSSGVCEVVDLTE